MFSSLPGLVVSRADPFLPDCLLHHSVHKQTGSVTIPLALSDTADSPGPVTEYRAHAFDLSEEYFDFQFMGHAQQCGDEAMCKKFEQEFTWVDFMSVADQNQVSRFGESQIASKELIFDSWSAVQIPLGRGWQRLEWSVPSVSCSFYCHRFLG